MNNERSLSEEITEGFKAIETMRNNEPVAWINREEGSGSILDWDKDPYSEINIPLYTHPVKELTDEEIWELADMVLENSDVIGFARAILRKAQKK